MKTKALKIMTLFMTMALAACNSGASNNEEGQQQGQTSSDAAISSSDTSSSSADHVHTFNEAVWENDANYHWHPATCEHTNQKGDRAAHTFEAFSDAEHVNKDATCSEPGVKYEKCSVCGRIKETVLTAEHDMQAVSYTPGEGEVAISVKKCSRDNHYELSWDAQDSAKNASGLNSEGKLSNKGNYVEYKFSTPVAIKARLLCKCTFRSNEWYDRNNPDTSSQAVWYDYKSTDSGAPDWKYTMYFDNEVVNQETQKVMVGDEEVAVGQLSYGDLFESGTTNGVLPWVELDLTAGVHTIKFERVCGYTNYFETISFVGDVAAD